MTFNSFGMKRLPLAVLMVVILTVRYSVWMPNRWARIAMLGLFLVGIIGGISAAHPPIPLSRPTAPLPAPKPDAAVWDALTAEAAALAALAKSERNQRLQGRETEGEE